MKFDPLLRLCERWSEHSPTLSVKMRLSRASLARVLHGGLDVTRSSRGLSAAGPSCNKTPRWIPCRRMSSPPRRESSGNSNSACLAEMDRWNSTFHFFPLILHFFLNPIQFFWLLGFFSCEQFCRDVLVTLLVGHGSESDPAAPIYEFLINQVSFNLVPNWAPDSYGELDVLNWCCSGR